MVTKERVKLVRTGNEELDQKLDGGIARASLTLVEGGSTAGKSVLAQHFTHAALRSQLCVAHYSTRNTIKEFMSQMVSLELDVTDDFLCDRLRVYSVLSPQGADSGEALNSLTEHFESLPVDIELIIVDALSDLVAGNDGRKMMDFVAACRQLCERGRTIVVTVSANAGDDELLERIRSMCNTHLVLRLEKQDQHTVGVMEVAKLNDVDSEEGNLVGFEVEPGSGLKVVPLAGPKR